ncbi:hypothetical protein [Paragemmobacter straminiformis]|nr:hypothetical protein [Gemmobacter straminiformis]
MRKLLILGVVAVVLAGCNTVSGAGQDISAGANTVQGWFNR